MTSMIAKAEVLKQDGRGRVRMPAQRREAVRAEELEEVMREENVISGLDRKPAQVQAAAST